MVFRQIVHDDLGCASYLIGDENAGVAAVVDPKLDIDEYLALARYVGVDIAHVLETHNHADHVSGHGRLAAATGATIHVHRQAEVDYEHVPFDDGFELELGMLRVRAIHTPGHRPEHTSFALTDTSRGTEPWAVLTGDSLFVGDIARPDLAVEKQDGARSIFRSLHQKLLSLPPGTEVWPAHLGGSLCGGPGMDMKISSTVGFEAAHNDLLQEQDEGRFVERAIAGLAPQPPNFRAIVQINRGPLDRRTIEAVPLTPRQVQQSVDDGTLIVDVRTAEQFDDSHIRGSVAITILQAGFGSRLAWLADRDKDIVVVGRDDEDARARDRARRRRRPAQLRRLPVRRDDGLAPGQAGHAADRAPAGAGGAGAARGRGPAAPRRARALRMGRRPHRRLRAPRVSRHQRAARRDRPRPPGGGRVRVGPARGHRRQPARAPRGRDGHPRRRRRRAGVAARAPRRPRSLSMEHWDLRQMPMDVHRPAVLQSDGEGRAIALSLPAGERLQEHQVHERAWMLVVDGTIEIESPDGETVNGGAGLLAVFDPAERREVRATADARLLLLLAPWPGEGR